MKLLSSLLILILILFYFFQNSENFLNSNLKMQELILEHAISDEQLKWGLMNRKEIANNAGMLFHFKDSKIRQLWMFNCYIDLAVAFLDENNMILEIYEMKAFPEKMDSKKPIRNLTDIDLYSPSDPIIQFFHKNSIRSKQPARYALEMDSGWFQKNKIKVGDQLLWEANQNKALILRN